MKTIIKSIMLTCAMTASAVSIADDVKSDVPVAAQPTSEETLLKAQKTLADAEKLAESIIAQAQIDADAIRNSHDDTLVGDSKIAPEVKAIKMQDEIIAIELHNTSVPEVLKAILPNNWRVLLDASEEIKHQKIDLVAQKTRDEILQDLAMTLKLQYQYFDQIKDDKGQSSPLFVIRQVL